MALYYSTPKDFSKDFFLFFSDLYDSFCIFFFLKPDYRHVHFGDAYATDGHIDIKKNM